MPLLHASIGSILIISKVNHGISTFADLRIASKRAYYDNNKPYGESETITLYIYNAGPDIGKAPVVRAGYTYSMNYNSVSTTLRQAQTWGQPSQAIRYGTLTWTTKSSPTSRIDGWDAVTTLPDIPAGILMELSLSFPMTHETSYNDYTASASVSSSTTDPRPSRKSTTYIITPNHHGGGGDYWNTPGNLTNLDFNGLTNAAPLSQADLRIASSRARYNNNLPYGKSETLSFLVFNGGPTIASKPVVTASYTTSMDYDNMSCRGEQVWVPDGANPSLKLDNSAWHSLDGVSCRIQGWNVISSLPDIPPTALYRINFTFPMTRATTYQDYTGTASVSSQATELNPGSSSTSYVITPNHNNDGDAYWQARGNITQLDGPSKPSGSRACLTGWDLDTPIIASDHGSRVQVPLKDLEKWIAAGKSEVISYDIARKTLRPRLATDVEYGNSSQVTVLSFSADGKTELTYRAHPDTRLYLSPINIASGNDQLRLGYWIPVRMLWVGAAVRGMAPDGGTTLAYVTNVQQVSGGVSQYRSVAPRMVSQSHSYVVGTLAGGGILSHNPGGDQLCGDANVPAILAAVGLIANRLVATTTPRPDLPNPPHGYSLRRRRPTDRPPPAIPAPPVLPIDVPRRDENGNWLIYLYEEDTPGAVENARTSVVDGGQPWRLTYDPLGANARRRQSTGRYQSQRELLQLTAEELTGRTGTLGQLDRDEYPPAIASEGGAGAVVTYVEAGDNRRAGSLMGQQINNYRMDPQPDGHRPLRQGDTFRYVFIHNNMAGLEYLGDNVDAESQLERPPID